MKNRVFVCLLVGVSLTCRAQTAGAQLDEIFKKAGAVLGHDNSQLNDNKIIAGLKEALQVSTGKAVALTGRTDGFLENQAIRILLPPRLQTVGKGMGTHNPFDYERNGIFTNYRKI